MPDYKEMYHVLFRETARAIVMLQAAQLRTEAMFVEDEQKNNLIELKNKESPKPLQSAKTGGQD